MILIITITLFLSVTVVRTRSPSGDAYIPSPMFCVGLWLGHWIKGGGRVERPPQAIMPVLWYYWYKVYPLVLETRREGSLSVVTLV